MRIIVVGNCQVRTVAACLGALLPEHDVSECWVESAATRDGTAVLESIGDFDVVVSQPLMTGPFAYPSLRERARRLIVIPQIVFTGFHPDDVVIVGVRGELGTHHSAIIVASFLLGLPQRRCGKLFNAFVYASLGYFDRFGRAREYLLQRATRSGLPLDGHFDTWPHPFMYNVHHPRLQPLASVARAVAARIADGEFPAEQASGAVAEGFDAKPFVSWPVYPEIATRLGLPAAEMRFAFPQTAPGLSLGEFIARSYRLYETVDRAVLEAAVEVELPILRGLLAAGPGA